MKETVAEERLPKSKYLLVGLGNPGRRYKGNRHNIGFMTIDGLAEKFDIRLSRVQSNAIVGNAVMTGQTVILAKPQSFMNFSGNAVGSLARYYRIPMANILVIYDEIDLPFGTLRFRKKGGAGGHNGMRSIINQLGREFPRLRLGVGRPPGYMDPADYVLQNFDAGEKPIVTEMIDLATTAIRTYIEEGIDITMTRHNGQII